MVLRNPYGNGSEWKGPWSDNSDEWEDDEQGDTEPEVEQPKAEESEGSELVDTNQKDDKKKSLGGVEQGDAKSKIDKDKTTEDEKQKAPSPGATPASNPTLTALGHTRGANNGEFVMECEFDVGNLLSTTSPYVFLR